MLCNTAPHGTVEEREERSRQTQSQRQMSILRQLEMVMEIEVEKPLRWVSTLAPGATLLKAHLPPDVPVIFEDAPA